ncbi:MAG: protein translocase subunit SecF [Methanobacteriaceae archaeon]|jgi:preprotein translocase subunit SecF|nr:MAG: preprotein translocase subunit SecF [Methanobacterium sp. BRmetb2]MCC7557877.1 protein translocase subunit SecF [Methanobacteriaceae archaeon]
MKIKIMESYKPLIVIPVIITLLAIAVIAINGLPESIDLQGGSIAVLNLEKPVDRAELTNIISQGLNTTDIDINSLTQTQATIEIGGAADVIKLTDSLSGIATIESFRSVGPLISQEALTQVYWAIAFAFLFMSITVFIIFRNFVPSVAVIIAALSDILIAVGGMSIFGIPLSVASVGAILMLIGYSVDTDILLTTRVLKRREGTITERAQDAFNTGLVMSASAISSLSVLYIVTVLYIPYAQVLSEIAAVLIIGLVADLLTTWLMNLGILRWYLEAKR